MRILYSVQGYKPAYRMGGPVQTAVAVAERLARRGHEVTVFTTDANLGQRMTVPVDQPVSVDGVEVWYFKQMELIRRWFFFIPYFSKSSGFLYAPAMRRQLDRLVPQMDLVHVQMPFIYPTLAAAWAARKYDKPLFYHQHGVFDPERLKFRGMKKKLYIGAIERPVMNQATTLIALTEAEEANYRALGARAPCRVIPNGIEPAPTSPADSQRAETRFNISPAAKVILFLARLHPVKGADRLIRAFLAIHRQFPETVLVMAGPDEWGMAGRLRQETVQAGLGHRILFPGMVTGEAKEELLTRADLFCLPSSAEGFSVAVLEAMAHSTAVLLSPGCHFPEIEEAGAGRVVSPEPEIWGKAMAEMLQDPVLLREAGERGRELVSRCYSWDAVTEQFIETYSEGIARHDARRCGRPGRARSRFAGPRGIP